MRAYSAMPLPEFVQQIRDAAIRNNADPIIIGKIDDLRDAVEEDVESLKANVENLEEEIDDLRAEIVELQSVK